MTHSPTEGTGGAVERPSRGNLALRVALSLLPFVGTCAVLPLVNRVTPYVLGLPFLVFWISAWTVLTSLCMAAVHLLDPARRQDGS